MRGSDSIFVFIYYVYLNECMYEWKSLMKHHCLKKENFKYGNLNMEDITDSDYIHAKRI